jgi:hypothetical protein
MASLREPGEMLPVDLMLKLPTEDLKAQFFKELMSLISDPLAPLPTFEEQKSHLTELMNRYMIYIQK